MIEPQTAALLVLATFLGLCIGYWIKAALVYDEKRRRRVYISDDSRMIELARQANEARRSKRKSSHIVTDLRNLRHDALRKELAQ